MSTHTQAVWDMHHHWVNEEGYIDRLLKEMDKLNIEKLGMIAMGDFASDLFILHGQRKGAVGNEDLVKLTKEHGDRFWGWGFIRLGKHKKNIVDKLSSMGMGGLKFHAPLKPYSDDEYMDVYAKAQELGLPCLFHTGIFYPPSPMPGERIWSEKYRPIHLEKIAHEFPKLKIIMAHLGVCWNEEAAALCRICPNIYADMSGRVDGWRSSKPMDWFKQILYWPDAYKKIMFGSDVHSDEIHTTLEDHLRIFKGIGWNQEQIDCAMKGNIKKLLER